MAHSLLLMLASLLRLAARLWISSVVCAILGNPTTVMHTLPVIHWKRNLTRRCNNRSRTLSQNCLLVALCPLHNTKASVIKIQRVRKAEEKGEWKGTGEAESKGPIGTTGAAGGAK